MTFVYWHSHLCRQCGNTWECGGIDCATVAEVWCPNRDLCHILPGETAAVHTIPKERRHSRGIGPLFHETQEVKEKNQ